MGPPSASPDAGDHRAGSELFTGHTMFPHPGVKAGKITAADLLRILPPEPGCNNLIGSVVVALALLQTGGSLPGRRQPGPG